MILPRLHFLNKTYRVDFTLGSPDWTVQQDVCTEHVLPARILQLLEWGASVVHVN